MPRRIWSLVAAIALIFACVLPSGSVEAQDGTSTFTLHFGTCSWMSSTRDIVFAPTMGSADSAFDCVAGPWPAELVSFTLDGVAPNSTDGATSIWTNLPNGLHSLDTSPSAPIQLHQDIIVGGDTDIWATLYFTHTQTRPDIPPTQPQTHGTVIANLITCDVVGTADSVTLLTTSTPPDALHNCRDGWEGSADFLTLDGAAPDSLSATTAIWNDVPYGDHFVSAGSLDPRGDLVITLDSGVAHVWASWDRHMAPGATVRIYIAECAVAPAGESWIGGERQGPIDWTDCHSRNVDAREWGLRVDGRRPDAFADDWASWNLANGTHVATTESGARYEFTIQDDQLTLAAWFGPNGTPSGGAAPGATVTPAPRLPNTGVGAGAASGSPMAGLLVASIVTLTVAVAGGVFRRMGRS